MDGVVVGVVVGGWLVDFCGATMYGTAERSGEHEELTSEAPLVV